jgi:non-heme chloroperoxidase
MRHFKRFMALAAFTALLVYAQDISGDWQGTLKPGSQELRIVLKVAKSDTGEWRATMLSIDQGQDRGAGMSASSFSQDGSNIKFAVAQIRGTYEGKLSADGASITGTWTQGQPLPLEFRRATKETAWADPSPHSIQFITVENNVKLEVLDWGGSGRPLVLLAGLGNTAHIFDKFAPKLTATYHVYGITRRGFGASSSPSPSGDTTYSADRLGDDVLAVLDALKLNRPVLAGHSLGGEELSSIGSRHPGKVAGLIYLDAGYSYAFYDRSKGDMRIDLADLQKKLEQLQPGKGPQDPRHLIEELLTTTLPGFERDLKEMQKNLPDSPPAQQPSAQVPPITQAIMAGMQKYTEIKVPILAIYAVPHATGQPFKDDAARVAADARDEATTGAQAKAFESGVPSAKVVRLPHANHYVFFSNEPDVLREMNAFLSNLP